MTDTTKALNLPELPTLSKELLNLIGEYGMARTDGVNELEIQHRWLTMIEGIKSYASAYALAAIEASRATAAQEGSDAVICTLATDCGFTLRRQPDGSVDLNPYVYDFARALLSSVAPKVPDGFDLLKARELAKSYKDNPREASIADQAVLRTYHAVTSSLSAAPSAPQAEGDGWISVDERLPTHIYSVLGYVTEGPFTLNGTDPMRDIVSYDPERNVWLQSVGEGDAVVKVSHWQDMPPAPIATAPMPKGVE